MVAELDRVARTCSSMELFNAAKSIFIDRLQRFNIDEAKLEYLRAYKPYRKFIFPRPPVARNIPVAYFVLPYHPLFEPISGRIRAWNSSDSARFLYLSACGHEPPDIRVAWKLSKPHLITTLRRTCEA
eukprot:1833057-Karenia_brevis.AAC.1